MPTTITNILYDQPTNIICLGMIAYNKRSGYTRWEMIPEFTEGTNTGYTTIGNKLRIYINNDTGLEEFGGQNFSAILHKI